MATSLSDIAERAGVSVKTVSGALHGGSARMSDDTRLKIKTIAEELGYVTNLAARGVRQGWLPLVGVVMGHGHMRRELFDAWVAAGARAIVHAGFGGGTVPEYLKPVFAELCARGVPVVRCSRVGAGPVIRNANFDDDA